MVVWGIGGTVGGCGIRETGGVGCWENRWRVGGIEKRVDLRESKRVDL